VLPRQHLWQLLTDPCAGAADHWKSAEIVGTKAAFEDHIVRFPSCAFAGLAKSRIAALEQPSSPTPNRFDGVWIIREICEKRGIWRADTYQFAGKIKDGIFHFEYGSKGEINSATYDGKIEGDGSAEIAVNGLSGDPANDPLHRPPGTSFHYKIAIKLDEVGGSGIRIETPRPCRSEWSKLSSAMTAAPSASPSSSGGPTDENSGLKREREKPRQESKSAETRRAKADVDVTQNRQITAGLSCTKMLGKCGAVCAANTGHPDCASTICVRLREECLSTGCWRGKLFSSCGLTRQ
jgi:hypothetical protein